MTNYDELVQQLRVPFSGKGYQTNAERMAGEAADAITQLRAERDALAAENRTLRNAAVTAAERCDALAALLREAKKMLAKSETYLVRRVSGWSPLRDKIDAALGERKI